MIISRRIDTFKDTKQPGAERYLIEFDGWHFEGSTPCSVFNKVLKYVFKKVKE